MSTEPLSDSAREHLNKIVVAAMTRFLLPSGDPVPEKAATVKVLSDASVELRADAEPDVERIYAAMVVAYSDLGFLPNSEELRKSIEALARLYLHRKIL
ncbi:MAG: hypothetical protein WA190_00095 [Usitatibacter sp.]